MTTAKNGRTQKVIADLLAAPVPEEFCASAPPFHITYYGGHADEMQMQRRVQPYNVVYTLEQFGLLLEKLITGSDWEVELIARRM